MFGYNVAEYPTNTFFASDLMHRMYHMPTFGEAWVEHYAETYEEVLELARTNSSYAVHDSESLQLFALEVYAHDIAIPGVGCPGPHAHGQSSASHAGPTHAATSDGQSSTPATVAPTAAATDGGYATTHSAAAATSSPASMSKSTMPTGVTADQVSATSDAPEVGSHRVL